MEQTIDWTSTALVIVDPQVDVLSPESVIWELIGEQVTRGGVVEKLKALRAQAHASGVPVFYSWISITEADYASWQARSGLQRLMASRRMMLPGKGARFAPGLEPTADTVVLAPRKTPSSQPTDLALQLRQRGIDTIVVAGMIVNLCVEAHVRDATDAGFNAFVIEDATAATDDATLAATLRSFSLTSSGLLSTEDALASLRAFAQARRVA